MDLELLKQLTLMSSRLPWLGEGRQNLRGNEEEEDGNGGGNKKKEDTK